MTQTAIVIIAERKGLEKVEKKTAIAVTSSSSSMIRPMAFSIAGSVAGAGHAARMFAGVSACMYASTR